MKVCLCKQDMKGIEGAVIVAFLFDVQFFSVCGSAPTLALCTTVRL